MMLFDRRTDSPTAPGCSSPCQTYSCENHKTVIRHAVDIRAEAKAKLRNINKPMKSGTRPTSSPNRAALRYRATYTQVFGRTGSSSVFGQKRCAHTQRRHCLSWEAPTRVSPAETTPLPTERRESPFRCERGESASQTRQTGDTAGPLGRQCSSASHPIDGYHYDRTLTPPFGRTSTARPRQPQPPEHEPTRYR